jgi:hypothetical protein
MRIKFVKTSDLSELESTANFLLLEGWERSSSLIVLPSGEFVMGFDDYRNRAHRGIPQRPEGSGTRPMAEEECVPECVPVSRGRGEGPA